MQSSNVSAGQTILATHHNYLRADAIMDIADKTTNYTVNKDTDYNKILTNKGASGEIQFSLPSVEQGALHKFFVYENQNVKIVAETGESIMLGTSSDLQIINSETSGTFLVLIGISSTEWVALQYDDSWSAYWNGDLDNCSYLEASISIGSQESSPYCVEFNSDRTKMYVAGYGATVYQYTLSTAGDVSTATYDSVNFSVSSQLSDILGMYFSTDGTKMYVTNNSDDVHQYTLSTAWDLSTASYDSKSFDVSSQATSVYDVEFSADGTKMYISNFATPCTVYQYTLSTAWDVSTASYASKSLNVNTQDTAIRGIKFNSDGTKMYMFGIEHNSVYQYTLSTAWDISTASYDSKSFDVSSQDSDPREIFISSDGLTLYMIGATNDSVYQYTLSTAWDISTASYALYNFYVGSQSIEPFCVRFGNNGTKMYILEYNSDVLYQYTLSTAWDVRTASYNSINFDMTSQGIDATSVIFNSDGTKMFYLSSGADSVYQYTLSTAWDISTASYDSKSFSVSSQTTSPTGLSLGTDGTKMYVMSSSNDSVYQYTLSTAWDISTASYDSKSFSTTTQDSSARTIFINASGYKMYMLGGANNTVYEYTLSTAWDISTASYDSKSFSVSSQETSPTSLWFNSGGTKMYIIGTTNDTVYQYTIT